MEPLTIEVRVHGAGIDAEQLTARTRNLQQLILAMDVEDAEDTARALRPEDDDALAVTVPPSVLNPLVSVVASWLSRQPEAVDVELDGRRLAGSVTRAQRDELVAAYLGDVVSG
ncbi:hypothetical protein [Symbioplanes lichenis]|uniref:hypothetical protein n=1 Tax=Symbioplanes lichenis TaxID=1629072 RepID=UPI002738C35D|nr:hypothetical protein [Actinoplanes lichenis]